MNQKKFINIIIIIAAVMFIGIVGYFIVARQSFFQKSAKEINSFKECVAAGYRIMESYPEQCKTPDGRIFVRDIVSDELKFGGLVIFSIGKKVKFDDGLTVTLVEINDSRCKQGVVCIWAGELSPFFNITGGDVGELLKEIRLGTATIKSATENGYTFILKDVTATEAMIVVTKKEIITPTPDLISCAQDAKQCSDGSYVSRTGKNCEFIACPEEGGNQVSLRVGQREGSLLVEKVFSDHITGLNFMEYPVARNQGFPIILRIGESASNGCTITLTLASIQGDTAIFTEEKDFNRSCPICLAGNTFIDTPSGLIAVKDLRVGMSVWTIDKSGKRVSGVVVKTSKTPVSRTHQMIHLILNDGRELFVSPGHPTVDGRMVGDFIVNDFYDGARVTASGLVAYDDTATYDILPSGETGFYWANGILLGSTLR